MYQQQRSLRESLRNIPVQQHNHRRGTTNSLNSSYNYKQDSSSAVVDDHLLDLFSKSRRSLSLPSSDDSPTDVLPTVKLGRLSLGGSAPKQLQQGLGKNTNNNSSNHGLDEFLSSDEGAAGGKHDYDWLLTPPGTPLVASSDGNHSQPGFIAPRRSVSTTKASRLSVSQSESTHVAKSTRSSSMTRPSISSSQYSTYSNKSTNILNTSSASVSSYIRPSTPTRSSTTRPSTPSGRSTSSRSTTPSRPRPSLSTSTADKPRPSQNSRPSTPTSRPQISTSMNSPAPRVTSRPSTPTRRSATPSLSPVSIPSTPGGRSLQNGRNSNASVSRPSSPGPRVRSTPQPIVLPDFPHETPPNLRTSMPDRPISAGRSRPGASLAAKGNVEPMANNSSVLRRQSSPVVTRGRLSESSGRSRTLANETLGDAMDSRREPSSRKPARTSTDSTGFGRSISKKSLDMAIRHMDLKNGSNGVRSLTGSNLFPQSIRATNQKQPGAASVNGSQSVVSNGGYAENGDHIRRYSDSGSEENRNQTSAKLSNSDIYESSRYDMILLKEDLKSTNWLHSLDDKADQGPIFDNGFEHLPEPFEPL